MKRKAKAMGGGLFREKKWKWTKSFNDECQCWTYQTPFGSFTVERTRNDFNPEKPWESWKWGYCFDEYYDEEESECESAAEGKRLCLEEWRRRMSHEFEQVIEQEED